MTTSKPALVDMALAPCQCQSCYDFYASATADKMGLFTTSPDLGICYVGECVVCHEDTMLPPGETTGICDACKPHVCIPELPEDDWCDLCGRTFPTPI